MSVQLQKIMLVRIQNSETSDISLITNERLYIILKLFNLLTGNNRLEMLILACVLLAVLVISLLLKTLTGPLEHGD